MNNEFIDYVKKNLLAAINKQMENSWLAHYKADIDRDMTGEIEEKEQKRAKNVANDYNQRLKIYQEEKETFKRDTEQYKKDKKYKDEQEDKYNKNFKNYGKEVDIWVKKSSTERGPCPRVPQKPFYSQLQEPKEPIHPFSSTIIKKYGFEYPSQLSYKVELSAYEKEDIRHTITANYRKKFMQSHWPSLAKALDNQIKQLTPETLITSFIIRHPWLEKELIYLQDTGILYQYLYGVLDKHLLSLLTNSKNTWSELSQEQLDGNLTWKQESINQSWLKKHINGYPLSDINKFYLSNTGWITPTFDTKSGNNKNWVNHPFYRIDVFRILYNICNNVGQLNKLQYLPLSRLVDVSSTRIAPLIYTELSHLSEQELTFFETLVININTEDKPEWIVVNKENNQWYAYIHSNMSKNVITQRLQQLSSIAMTIVDISLNKAPNDLDNIATDSSIWHAIVFSRILPWCIAQSLDKGNLVTYRHTVPFSVLLHETMENSLKNDNSFLLKKKELTKDFIDRAPFSARSLQEQKLVTDKHLLTTINTTNDTEEFRKQLNVKDLLNSFDKKFTCINSEQNQLTIKTGSSIKDMTQALNLIYHTPSLTCVEFPNLKAFISYTAHPHLHQLFNFDINLKAIKPTNNTIDANIHYYPLECAARNRFLAQMDESYLKKATNASTLRHDLWKHTGQLLVAFFRHKDAILIDSHAIGRLKKFNEQWQKNCCESKVFREISSHEWLFIQIAQMGKTGLDELFQHLTENYSNKWETLYEEPAPALNYTVDASNGLTIEASDYIRYLTTKIKDFNNNKKNCTPLFKSFSLILPNHSMHSTTFFQLIDALSSRKEAFEQETGEIILYELTINDRENTLKLLTEWNNKAQNKNCLIMPCIPAWDSAIFEEKELQQLKCLYRAVQNKVLDNQRLLQHTKITKNTRSIYDLVEKQKNTSTPNHYKDSIHSTKKVQPWDGDDEIYPLAAQSLGIQQQLQQGAQQAVAYEAKQQQQVEQESEYEQAHQIARYGGNEEDLITRETVEMNKKAYECWQKNKAINRFDNDMNLKNIFSLWVGSDVNAPNVIEKIDYSAWEKLAQNASRFRLGLTKDNLPPGFSVKLSQKNGLILCFSDRKEKEDLFHRKQLAINEATIEKNAAKEDQSANIKTRYNPFTVELPAARKAQVFDGDFRQFDVITNVMGLKATDKYDAQQTLWKFLATDDNDETRLNNASDVFKASKEDALVIEQRYTLEGLFTNKKVGTYQDCLNLLKQWAGINHVSNELIDLLFDEKSKARLTTDNLKAFGQLFNDADIIQKDPFNKKSNPTQHWLLIADQILRHFGPSYFSIWKNALLDLSQNWTELLEQVDVDAIVDSIAFLKNDMTGQEVWWALVKAHSQATGHMRYSELWNAYRVVLTYLKKNDLHFCAASMITYLTNNELFNGQVFLDRFYRVLKNASQRFQIHNTILQTIIDNVDDIDWCHNGFYYASRYERNLEWDKALKLTKFSCTERSTITSYEAHWDNNETIVDFNTHALRFIMQHTTFVSSDIKKIKDILTAVDFNGEKALIGRLFIASLVLKSEKINKLSINDVRAYVGKLEKINPTFINWLNNQLMLAQHRTDDLCLRLHDIAAFAQGIEQCHLQEKLDKLSTDEALVFINACGRALQCYNSKLVTGIKETNFSQLLDRAFKSSLSLTYPLLHHYPWLINDLEGDDKELLPIITETAFGRHANTLIQVNLFKDQLHSIDYSNSRKLPAIKTIASALTEIKLCERSENLKQSAANCRDRWVASLREDGCNITNVGEKRFRKLNDTERNLAKKRMVAGLKGVFTNQNLTLFEKLVDECSAVISRDDNTESINKFIDVLRIIDNKNHYNELAPVIGLLISNAKKEDGSYRQYTIEQLTDWLEAMLLPQAISKIQHYSVDLLKELLNDFINQKTCSLINSELNYLKAQADNSGDFLKREVIAIVNAELPNLYKPALIKMAIQGTKNNDKYFVAEARKLLVRCYNTKLSPVWLEAICELLTFSSQQSQNTHVYLLSVCNHAAEQLDSLKYQNVKKTPALRKVWQEGQIRQINIILKNNKLPPQSLSLELTFLNKKNSSSYAYIYAILMHGINDWHNESALISVLIDKLTGWSENELCKLAGYYAEEPNPTLKVLNEIIDKLPNNNTADAIIHYYESVLQSLNADGTQKRHYSLTSNDKDNVNRILRGFKRKGQYIIVDSEQKKLLSLLYYTNAYSQSVKLSSIRIDGLQTLLYKEINYLKKQSLSDTEKHYARARVIACMREILLRKSGKWANHTQILDLLYSAIYDNESLIHQVRTGQGKSIITIMRAAYLALNGYVVDVHSAKDSLSHRDHDAFGCILDAMKIPNNYIASTGAAMLYQTNDLSGVGAVNYVTPGNFSLFHSNHIWIGRHKIDLTVLKRVAFIDEIDYVLNDEQTQFNYSDANNASNDNDAIYNLDAWVYSIVNDYYKELMSSNIKRTDNGVPLISCNSHLKELCQRIENNAKLSPKESRFLQKYITPALTNDKEMVARRNQQLKLLLTAAHAAHGLQEGIHYCKCYIKKNVANGMVITARFAKVMIDNQVKDGSTYSAYVQQFLHDNLNREAVIDGETPDFFIEPESEIAISQNARYLLKKYYDKMEGCTGTAGNLIDLKDYEDVYGIKHVIKLPTHEPVKTNFLEPVYCTNNDSQYQALAEKIIENAAKTDPQSILITCEDDIAVKRITLGINASLIRLNKATLNDKIICDTNDTGKSEAVIVPIAGLLGAITISARLGRGTDIKPQSAQGLMVLRTYPAMPRIVKQERGRQGRNGASGSVQEIINYDAVLREYKGYQTCYKTEIEGIVQQQEENLNRKIEKHNKNELLTWQWTNNNDLREKYIITRAVQALKQQLLRRSETYIRQKEHLIATLSGNIMDVLHDNIDNLGSALKKEKLQDDWLRCRRKIEASWDSRLIGTDKDTDKTYEQFFEKVKNSWQELCQKHSQLDTLILIDLICNESQADDAFTTIVKQGEIWQNKVKIATWKPNDIDVKKLETFNKSLKRLIFIYHPDKQKSTNDTEKDNALRKAKQLNDFAKIKDECLARLENQPVFQQTTSADEKITLTATKGAIVVKDMTMGDIKCAPTLAKKEMNIAIECYQQWIETAQGCYFGHNKITEALIDKIYGKTHREGLTNLFLALHQVSCHDSGQLALNEPMTRFNNFLTTFKDILKIPGVYYISCQELSNTILFLTNKLAAEDNDNLAYLGHFFKQNWFNDITLATLPVQDIKKHNRLLKLVMAVVCQHLEHDYQEEKTNFIDNISQVIRENYWDRFDDEVADDIISLFAYNHAVSELIVKLTNRSDLAHFITLMISNKQSGHKNNKEQLGRYLTDNFTALSDLKGIIRPLFTIILSNKDKDNIEDYLPKNPNVLKNINDSTIQNAFWNFLVDRQCDDKKQLTTLIERLSTPPESKAFIKTVLKPLLALPNVLPLKMINDVIGHAPGLHHYEDIKPRLEKLTSFGIVLTRFIAQHRLVIENPEALKKWLTQIDTLGFDTSQRFFEAIDNDIPLATLYLITEKMALNAPFVNDMMIIIKEMSIFYRNINNIADNALKTHLSTTFLSYLGIIPVSKDSFQNYNTFIDRLAKFYKKVDKTTILDEEVRSAILKTFKDTFSQSQVPHDSSIISTYDRLVDNVSSFYKKIDDLTVVNKKFKDELLKKFNAAFKNSQASREAVVSDYNQLIDNLSKFYKEVDKLILVDNGRKDELLEAFKIAFYQAQSSNNMIRVISNYNKIIATSPNFYQQLEKITVLNEITKNRLSKQFTETLKNGDNLEAIKKYNSLVQGILTSQAKLTINGKFIEDNRLKTVQDNAYKTVCNAFTINETLTEAGLSDAFNVVENALLRYKSNNVFAIFTTYIGGQKERQTMMQYLHNGLLNLNDDFIMLCENAYQTLSQNLINNYLRTPINYTNTAERYQGLSRLRECFHTIVSFTRELIAVNQPISRNTNQSKNSDNSLYNPLFEEHKKNYSGFWWVNSTRKQQAKELFNASNRMSGASRFELLKEITRIQKNILLSDQYNMHHNKKGYSRLYDITMQMSAKIMSDCLSNCSINVEEKNAIEEYLQCQLIINVDMLKKRLPNNKFKKELEQINLSILDNSHDKLEKLCLCLGNPNHYKTTPMNLRYLVDNLMCFANESNTLAEAKNYNEITKQFK